MKQSTYVVLFGLAVLTLVALPARRAAADDETSDTEIKIQAPLDAVDCTATPPTVTVLGLSIDITNASFDSEGQESGTSGQDDGQSSSSDSSSGSATSCTTLTPSQMVDVKLPSDITPLAAAEVDPQGDGEVEIDAPVQDVGSGTITVLGLTVDVSSASVEGADDQGEDGNSQPVDLSQVTPGQFVKIQLDAGQLPALVASSVEVKNFANQVEVEVQDSSGSEVEDMDEGGAPVNDVSVDVVETVKVTTTTATGRTRRVRKTVNLHTSANGTVVLNGLPTGHAKIYLTRVKNGVTTQARRGVRVKPNTTRRIRARLR